MTIFSNVCFCVIELSMSFTYFSMKTLIFFSLQLFFKLFLYYAALGLQCLASPFFSCSEWGLLSLQSTGSRASVVAACGLGSPGSGALERGSVIVAPWMPCSAACGIFLAQGLNPWPLNWKVDA